MKAHIWMFGLVLFLAGCNSSSQEKDTSFQSISTEGQLSNADIIRNPVSATAPLDTANIAKIQFDSTTYHFGEVFEGDKVTHKFSFTNTGKTPLIISDARSTCGCTVPKWPDTPIAPGEKGEIEVRFDTKGKSGRQSKPVTITANTYPSTTRIYLTGMVRMTNDE
ncbi:MAG: DUF1573 domain-containing protein [Saprospiraceae bacterium]|nr:DUF1573 domain-containing protein [Saprospiraceae bacterium]